MNNRADDIMTQETLLPTTQADTMLGGEETKNGGIADRSKLFYYHYQLLRMWRMSMIMSRNQPTRLTTGPQGVIRIVTVVIFYHIMLM